jgi:hypothetical protein
MEEYIMVNKQPKKNLKQRAARIFKDIRIKSEVPLMMKLTGSMAKGGGKVKVDDNGFYDLDFDIVGKFPGTANETYQYIKHLINPNLRSNESSSVKKRVIRITINETGYKYKFDIAIKKFAGNNNSKRQTVIKKAGGTFE